MVAFFLPPVVASVADPLPVLIFQQSTQQSTGTTYTFASQNIGASATNRYIIVAAGVVASGARTISSVTVGGISATAIITAADTNNLSHRQSLYIVAVPTGSTSSVVVTASGACLGCSISVWAAYDISSATPVDSDSRVASSSPLNVPSLTTSADGFLVANTTYLRESGTASFSWTGVTERSELNLDVSGSGYGVSAADISTSGAGIAPSVTLGGTVDVGIALAASFR